MKLYKRMKREMRWDVYRVILFYIVFIIPVHFTYYMLSVMEANIAENSYNLNKDYLVFEAMWLPLLPNIFGGIIIFIIRMKKKRKYIRLIDYCVGQLDKETWEIINLFWEDAHKYIYKGSIVAVAAEYLLVRCCKSTVWYMVDLNHIKKVKIIDFGNNLCKLTVLYTYTYISKRKGKSEIRDKFMTSIMPQEMAREILDEIESYTSEEVVTDAFSIKSKILDEKDCYGGDQYISKCMPDDVRQRAMKMIGDRFDRPPLTDEEFDIFLTRLDSEGCAYVALANTIFLHYEGKEEEFMAKFGYPMYKENGQPQFEHLIIDFYATMDNVNPETMQRDMREDYIPEIDGEGEYDYWKDCTGIGMLSHRIVDCLSVYLKKYNTTVYVNYRDYVMPQSIEQYYDNGCYILISVGKGMLINDERENYIDSRHLMLVTGNTADNNYIVSSWGQKFILEAKSIIDPVFYKVEYVG